jgi:hypothetical protein
MALQVIIVNQPVEAISRQLGNITRQCEIFPIGSDHVGVSVSTKVLEVVGEDRVRESLAGMDYYDLYDGRWVVRR